MPRNFSKYQYETSPRKLEPEYTPYKKRTSKSKKSTALKTKNGTSKKKKAKERSKAKVIAYILIGFAMVFAIGYRNAKIDEKFSRIQSLKQELADVEKENTQLEITIESSLNINNLAKQAKELLGMQKLTSKQTIYVEAPQADYVQASTEKIIIDNNDNPIKRIVDDIMNIF